MFLSLKLIMAISVITQGLGGAAAGVSRRVILSAISSPVLFSASHQLQLRQGEAKLNFCEFPKFFAGKAVAFVSGS